MNTGIILRKNGLSMHADTNFGSKPPGSVSWERSIACSSVWDIYMKLRWQWQWNDFFFLWWLGETGKCPDNYSSNFQKPFCLLLIWVSPILVSIHLLSSIPSHTLELHPSSSCSKIKQKYDLHVVLSSISFGCFLLFSSALGTSEVKQVSGKPHLNLILTINDPAQFWRKTQWSYISSFEIPPPQVHQPVMTVRG